MYIHQQPALKKIHLYSLKKNKNFIHKIIYLRFGDKPLLQNKPTH